MHLIGFALPWHAVHPCLPPLGAQKSAGGGWRGYKDGTTISSGRKLQRAGSLVHGVRGCAGARPGQGAMVQCSSPSCIPAKQLPLRTSVARLQPRNTVSSAIMILTHQVVANTAPCKRIVCMHRK